MKGLPENFLSLLFQFCLKISETWPDWKKTRFLWENRYISFQNIKFFEKKPFIFSSLFPLPGFQLKNPPRLKRCLKFSISDSNTNPIFSRQSSFLKQTEIIITKLQSCITNLNSSLPSRRGNIKTNQTV